MLTDFPEVRYADADGSSIAYAASGEGSVDLVVVPGVMTSILGAMFHPVVGQFYEQLASFTRLIQLDRRGTGMSDPLSAGVSPPLEQQVGDVVAVMDAVGSPQAALYGVSHGGPVGILCAAMHPERVSALILNCTVPCYDDYPLGTSVERARTPVARATPTLGQPGGTVVARGHRAATGCRTWVHRNLRACPAGLREQERRRSRVRGLVGLGCA